MSNQVYANNMEVSCKAAAGKSICAFPDVCMTPPQTPATPPGVPIPYPNTGMASDTSDGSSSVQISGQEIMLKNKSCFKSSTGDEAGSAPMKGLVTHKNTGKVYFNAWSMDVQIEGENVVRMMDLTTHNHGSMPGNSGPWPYTDEAAAPGVTENCKEDRAREEAACSDDSGACMNAEDCCNDEECQEARKCMLVPYGGPGSPNCCPGMTGHHLLPNSLLQVTRNDSSTNVPGLARPPAANPYTCNSGACVCVDGSSHSSGEHGALHADTRDNLRAAMQGGAPLSYEQARGIVADAHCAAFQSEGKPLCKKECLESQIDASLQPHRTGGPIQVRRRDGMTRMDFPLNDGVFPP